MKMIDCQFSEAVYSTGNVVPVWSLLIKYKSSVLIYTFNTDMAYLEAYNPVGAAKFRFKAMRNAYLDMRLFYGQRHVSKL